MQCNLPEVFCFVGRRTAESRVLQYQALSGVDCIALRLDNDAEPKLLLVAGTASQRHHGVSKANRKVPIPYDPALYRQRYKIENMFGRLKDWRRIHTRYDRCAHTFMSAICLSATVIFWLN